jgi:hypothetical protein
LPPPEPQPPDNTSAAVLPSTPSLPPAPAAIDPSAVVPFYFPPEKGDIFTEIPYHDTGSTYGNYATNWYYGLANLSAAILNTPGEMIAAAEDGLRAMGVAENDIRAAELWNLEMAGVTIEAGLSEAATALSQKLSEAPQFLRELLADERGSVNIGKLFGADALPTPSQGMRSGSGAETIYIENYLTDRMQSFVDQGHADLVNNPRGFFGYDYTQSPQFQLRFEAGHLLEGNAGNRLAQSEQFLQRIVEPIPYGEQAAGKGQLGDFRLTPPFQDKWNLPQWDVTTPGGALRKMEAGKDRIWLLYPSYTNPVP